MHELIIVPPKTVSDKRNNTSLAEISWQKVSTLFEEVNKLLVQRTYSRNELYTVLAYKRLVKPGLEKAFNRLIRFGVREGFIDQNKLISKTAKGRKLPKAFTVVQLKKYFGAVDEPFLAVASLLTYFCSLRPGEVIKVQDEDLDFEGCTVKVVQGKGKKDRYTPFIPAIHGVVKKWMQHKGRSKYLFPSSESHSYATIKEPHISVRTLQRAFEKALEKAGLDYADPRYANGERVKLTYYSLRHSFATHGLERGVDPFLIKEAMGHSKVDTTLNVYSHIAGVDLVNAFKESFERGKKKKGDQNEKSGKIHAVENTPDSKTNITPFRILEEKFALGEISEEELNKRKEIIKSFRAEA